MARTIVDLQHSLDEARRLFAEIEDLHDHPLASDPAERERQRDLLMDPLTELDERIIDLEAVIDEKAAAQVVVEGVTPEEVQQINGALAALDKSIRRTETFQANLAVVTAALGAVKTITSAGSRGSSPGTATS